MAKSSNPIVVGGKSEKLETVKEYTRRVFYFFKVRGEEIISTETVGNDLHIVSDRPIRHVYLNGDKIT